MNSSGKLSYIFRKFPLFRALLLVLLIAFVIVGIAVFGYRSKPVPSIESIVPAVGLPGDLVTITGKNFGNVRDMNYVEFAGSKLTSSAYVSWSDECIKLVLPSNVQDGLVVVGVNNLRSKPAMFANETGIPILVPEIENATNPTISSLSTQKINVGEILTIYGNNFGDSRGQSKVLFSQNYDGALTNFSFDSDSSLLRENMVPVSDFENGYEYWSNSEIRVKVPDGAYTGVVLVDTVKEISEPMTLVIDNKVGEKIYGDRKYYLMKYTADIADITVNGTSTITLRCPVPMEMPSQSSIAVLDIVPDPVLENYQRNIIHQFDCNKTATGKKVFTQSFVVPVFEITTNVNVDKVGAYGKASETLVNNFTKADSIVPADNESIFELATQIVKREKNPYKKARLIYDYMLNNFELLESNRSENADPLDLLSLKRGDTYDFAIIFTALLRSIGIPCLTDCGVLVNQELKSDAHWWCEFYIQNAGWIPVDLALGAELSYGDWESVTHPRDYYFGNLDSHHITFSRGINQLKPFSQDSKIVQRPKSFALQSFWEEASNDTVKYSSYWSKPIIEGVY